MGPEAEGYRKWVEWVEATGGDDPQKAADLVLRLTGEDGGGSTASSSGSTDPLQAPMPSWEPPVDSRPWN